ncbi:hypothetical protein DPMN_173107 [Dreissena polymorpha]|uniref:Uncharacterized protein n=1 Tax=Dreissena polymorpha TaxID=45954 RepID=A0A9D4E2T6_DREPO|nr:hypothetical protein DPMN_173107 [Dreissena polymorpha]
MNQVADPLDHWMLPLKSRHTNEALQSSTFLVTQNFISMRMMRKPMSHAKLN